MEILEFIKRQNNEVESANNISSITTDENVINDILKKEMSSLFPNQGNWYKNCFAKPKEVSTLNLPCNLRDNAWMSRLLQKKLLDKGTYIPQNAIKRFIDTSEEFANLRHEYELSIVKWQINWIIMGGKNWLPPMGYNENSLLHSKDIDIIIRGGVSKTLKAIGMDPEVIEEGLEKFSDTWRPYSMEKGFHNLYEPDMYNKATTPASQERLTPVDEEHKRNWIADREYKYYQTYKKSVDQYGTLTPAMQMTPEDHADLVATLFKQNNQRIRAINNWKNNSIDDQTPFDEDIL